MSTASTDSMPPLASDARRALLAQRLKGAARSADQAVQVNRRQPTQTAQIPASAGQKRVWLFQKLHPDSSAYHMIEAYRVRGGLDIDRLRDSVGRVIERHEILRTRFDMIDGDLHQIVEPSLALEIPVIEADALPLEAQLLALASRPFDLSLSPLLRVTVIQHGDETILLLVLHHIISDERSNGLIWDEIAAFYGGSVPDDVPAQYADFAYWQAHDLNDAAAENKRTFWRQRLAESPAQHDLPTDRPRPLTQSYRGALVSHPLSVDLSRRVRELAVEQRVTPSMVVLAAYALLLHRYSGQNELLIGLPVSERTRAGYEHTLGFFLNTVALRLAVDGNQTFAALLNHVRERMLEAIDHQDIPFDQVVESLDLRTDFSRHPLFQVMFVTRDKQTPVTLPGLTLEPFAVDQGAAKFDQTLFTVDTGEQFTLEMEYAIDLFDGETITRMLRHLAALIESVVTQADAPGYELAYLAPDEIDQLVRAWNQTAVQYTQQGLIADLIAQQAQAIPDALALMLGDDSLSYADFERRARSLARTLIDVGAQPGEAIALCFERSFEMFIAMYACLKIGCPYVPVDPEYPQARIAYILRDCGVRRVLTQAHIKAIPKQDDLRVIAVDTLKLDADGDDVPPRNVNAQTPAYIIYTSGSTGQPKGVVITHGGLTHSTLARHEVYEARVSRYLLLSPYVFDSSVAGIYWAWTQGGALVLPEAGEERSADALVRLIHERGVTHTLCLPSLYDVILSTASRDQLRTLRVVIVAGEACVPAVVKAHFRMVPNAGLYNEYGPTEGTVWSTVHAITLSDADGVIPIGRPIPNMKTSILDAYRQPVPVGVAGELVIAGAGLADRYLNQPALTDEKFVTFALTGERIYRTGDRARYRRDGVIEFLGRIDHQVKIRGHRIEPGEIEAVLLTHEDVRSAVVLSLTGDDRADAELVAFVAPADGAALERKAMREYAAARLPEYMIPARLHVLDAMPLTFNGKIDRNALIQVDREYDPQAERVIIAPRNPTEAAVAAIWSEMLGVDVISMDDDYLELGGHSLLAMRIIAKINRELKTNLTAPDVLQYPTVEALARRIAPEPQPASPPTVSNGGVSVDTPAPRPTVTSPHIVPIRTKGDAPIFWGIVPAQNEVFAYVNVTRDLEGEHPVYVLRLPGLDGEAKPYETIPALAAYYIGLIKQHQPNGPYLISGFSLTGLVALEIAQQMTAAGDDVGLVILFETFIYGEETTAVYRERFNERRRNITRKIIRRMLSLPVYVLEYLRRSPQARREWLEQRRYVLEDRKTQRARLERAKRALERATFHYETKPYTGDILYFATELTRKPAAGKALSVVDEWKQMMKGKFLVVNVPGTNHVILGGDQIDLVAAALRDHIRRKLG